MTSSTWVDKTILDVPFTYYGYSSHTFSLNPFLLLVFKPQTGSLSCPLRDREEISLEPRRRCWAAIPRQLELGVTLKKILGTSIFTLCLLHVVDDPKYRFIYVHSGKLIGFFLASRA